MKTLKIATVDNYEWTRHLRYEWDETNNQCSVMQSDAQFVYGFEYLGCSPRLVITPLTDRFFTIRFLKLILTDFFKLKK